MAGGWRTDLRTWRPPWQRALSASWTSEYDRTLGLAYPPIHVETSSQSCDGNRRRDLLPFAIYVRRRCRYGFCLLLAIIVRQIPEDLRKDKPFLQRKFFVTDNCPDGNSWVVFIEENLVEPFQPDAIASHRLTIEPPFERGYPNQPGDVPLWHNR